MKFVFILVHSIYGALTRVAIQAGGDMYDGQDAFQQAGRKIVGTEETREVDAGSIARDAGRIARVKKLKDSLLLRYWPLIDRTDESEMSLLALNQSTAAPSKFYGTCLMNPDGPEGLLGQGAMGAVYLKQTNCQAPKQVALKVQRVSADVLNSLKDFEIQSLFEGNQYLREIIDYAPRDKAEISRSGELYGLLEYQAGGDLVPRSEADVAANEELAAQAAYSAYKALAAMHELGYVHMDVSPANLLISRPRSECVRAIPQCSIKLTDFGNAQQMDEFVPPPGPFDIERPRWAQLRYPCGGSVSKEPCIQGSPRYQAPEFASRPSIARDLWALGVTIYELYFGLPLWDLSEFSHKGISEMEAMATILAGAKLSLSRGWVKEVVNQNKSSWAWDNIVKVEVQEGVFEFPDGAAFPVEILDCLLDPNPVTRGRWYNGPEPLPKSFVNRSSFSSEVDIGDRLKEWYRMYLADIQAPDGSMEPAPPIEISRSCCKY